MPGCRSGVHHTHVRELDLRSSGNADLERGCTFGLKGRRAAIPCSSSGTADHNAGASSGRAVDWADTRVVADRGVRYADVVGVAPLVLGFAGSTAAALEIP